MIMSNSLPKVSLTIVSLKMLFLPLLYDPVKRIIMMKIQNTVQTGKHLSMPFFTALTLLLPNFVLDSAIRKVKESSQGLEMKGTDQILKTSVCQQLT